MSKIKVGLHLGIPMSDYIADSFHACQPALSATVAHKLLEESPLHAWHSHPRLNPHWRQEEDTKFDLGSAVHAILLEGSTSKIAVVNKLDWRTKDAQNARDEARKAGMIPILTSNMASIEAMVGVAQEAISKSELADVFKPDGGDSEVTLLWKDGGIPCKGRPDRVSKDRRILCDYKSTASSAEPNAWTKGPMIANGFDLQAALGLRGITAIQRQALCASKEWAMLSPQFVFIVQENAPPYAVSFVGFGGQFQFYADARIQRAINVWGKCLNSNRWPGYPSRVAWTAPPPWKVNEWDAEMEEMDVS